MMVADAAEDEDDDVLRAVRGLHNALANLIFVGTDDEFEKLLLPWVRDAVAYRTLLKRGLI